MITLQPPSSKKLAFMALFAVVAPLILLQLYLLGMVPMSMNYNNMNDYFGAFNEVSSSNTVDNDSNSGESKSAAVGMNGVQRNAAAAGTEIFKLEKQPIQSNDGAMQPHKEILGNKHLFTNMPASQKHTFYIPCGKACHPMIRALRVLGWTRVNSVEEAQLVYTYNYDNSNKRYYRKMDTWQRYNTFMSEEEFDVFFDKVFTPALPFTVETYNLYNKAGVKSLQQRLRKEGDLDSEWILSTEEFKTTITQAKSDDIKNVQKEGGLVQKAVCNSMTWGSEKRKFDVRVFWFVASTEPLLVFYMDGWARIGGPVKKDLRKKFMEVQDTEESFESLASMLQQNYNQGGVITDPMMYVRNQMKQALGEVAAQILKDVKVTDSYNTKAKDAYELYTADFTIDQDLNVWMTNLEQETELGEDYYFRLALNHNINYGMASILQEIWEKQQEGLPLFPLVNNGLWEAVYADGWKFENEGGAERVPSKATC